MTWVIAMPLLVFASMSDPGPQASFPPDELQCRSSEVLTSTPAEAPAPYCSAAEMLTNPACAYPAAPSFPLDSRVLKDEQSPVSALVRPDIEPRSFSSTEAEGLLLGPHGITIEPPVPPPRRRS